MLLADELRTLNNFDFRVGKMAQFYRRKLPEFCISFSSDEGKKLFKEALDEGKI